VIDAPADSLADRIDRDHVVVLHFTLIPEIAR
jgi:hypothetical protein